MNAHQSRAVALPAALILAVVASCAGTQVTPGPTVTDPAPTPSMTSSDAATPTAGVPSASPVQGLSSDPLHRLQLQDVRDGSDFTLGQLAAEKPVLLEMMAIWCSNCRAQMHRVVEAHQLADFHSVGVDVDPSEVPDDLAAYVAEQGFDWPFAMADAELATLLRERFGDLVLNPPSMPMAILYPDGSIRQLDFGGHEVDELVAALSSA